MPFVVTTSASSVTGNDIIDQAIDLFLSGRQEEMNKLDGAIDSLTETVKFKYDLGGIRTGQWFEIDGEGFRVWNVDQAAKTANVQRGYKGTAALHNDATLVRIAPRISRGAAFVALNAELEALAASGLWTMAYIDLTYQSNVLSYDLADADGLLNVYAVRQKEQGGVTHWREIDLWRHDASAFSSDFPSGNSLYLPRAEVGQSVQVLYRSAFLPLLSPSDDLATVAGVPSSMTDILVYGILMRLGPVREIKRNFTETQEGATRANEVQPNAVQNSFAAVRNLHDQRITQERRRLNRLYPEMEPA